MLDLPTTKGKAMNVYAVMENYGGVVRIFSSNASAEEWLDQAFESGVLTLDPGYYIEEWPVH
jgi:hypothetical protein